MHIHVQWEGPFSLDQARSLTDNETDYGVYQVYGAHPVYGANVLIYIGKADAQTFGTRLKQETWDVHNQDALNIQIYVGRLHSYGVTPNFDDWSKQIAEVERLLIFSHWPAGNSSGLNVQFGHEHHELSVLNWGQYRDLLPEVSGARYSNRFPATTNYLPYGYQVQE